MKVAGFNLYQLNNHWNTHGEPAEKVKACINLLQVPPQEIAVFYRLNDMSRPIETASPATESQ